MRLFSGLPVAILVFFATSAPAQQPLPESYQASIAALAHLDSMTSTDVAVLVSKAQSGEPEAQQALAMVYTEGRLVRKDEVAARSWMLKAAEQGHVPAEKWMGLFCHSDVRDRGLISSRADAERWLRLAAAQGDAEAQFWLGQGYQLGYFGTIDYREALVWLRKSAAQGLPDAQYELGGMYAEGNGVPRSDAFAASWYRKAADHLSDVSGVFEAETSLVYMYRFGRLKRNDIEAYMWFAIVGSSVDPPVDDDIERIAKHMTKSEIAEAQHRAQDWVLHHKRQATDSRN